MLKEDCKLSGLTGRIGRVEAILLPAMGVVDDIGVNAVKIVIVADDVFEVIALPDRFTMGFTNGIDTPRRK